MTKHCKSSLQFKDSTKLPILEPALSLTLPMSGSDFSCARSLQDLFSLYQQLTTQSVAERFQISESLLLAPAFQKLIQDAVRKVLLKFHPGRQFQDELLQAINSSVWELLAHSHLPEFSNEVDFDKWLRITFRQLSQKWLHHIATSPKENHISLSAFTPQYINRLLADSRNYPSLEQVHILLEELIGNLPEYFRNLLLDYLSGLTLRESAEMRQIDISTVSRQRQKAIEFIRQIVGGSTNETAPRNLPFFF